MECMILGCAVPARGDVPAAGEVPAHYCRFCPGHPCEMERYVMERFGTVV